jgi:hypothetical protein
MNKQDKTSNCKGYIACSSLEELQKLARFTPVNGKKPYRRKAKVPVMKGQLGLKALYSKTFEAQL